jgi:uncharacterized protein (TIGR02284 family)
MSSSDALKSLHAKLIDARKGYETAREEADSPPMMKLFSEMTSLHEQFHQDIHRILNARGVVPDDDGTLLATVHKAVISVRSAVTGLDADSLSGFADGEKRILKGYDEAIVENAEDVSAVAILHRHRDRLVGVIDKMTSMQDEKN